jgi:N-dimethylarginine dimethylaminohydrolase
MEAFPSSSIPPMDVSVGIPSLGRPTFLMCAPTLYEVDYVINPWMDGNVHRSSREQAMAQWQDLYHALTQVASVMTVSPQPGWPDMVFTANAGLVRQGVVALSRFLHPERQGEESHFRKWFGDFGLSIHELPRATPFEGEGDALFDPDGRCLWAGHGVRTAVSSHRLLEKTWDVEVISLRLVDPRFYHLDTCFCPLFDGYLLYFPEAFDAPSLARIEQHYAADKLIRVSQADALRFACNAVNVARTIVLNYVSDELRQQLETRGFRVVQISLTEFLKAGGAAKCLALRLSELDVTHATSQ